MKLYVPVFVLGLLFLAAKGYSSGVTPKDILSEKYGKELFPEKFEYTQHLEKYKQALLSKKNIYRKLDSLASFETLPMWPVEEQQKYKHILELAKNDTSGDVYAYIRELGAEYAFTLNKVINLNDIYALERSVIKATNTIKEAEEWAEKVAKIASYFYEDFINGKLENDLFYYWSILYTDEEILEVGKKYNNNIGLFILDNEEKAKNLYYRWKKWEMEIKRSPEREFLFIQLEKRFTRTFQ